MSTKLLPVLEMQGRFTENSKSTERLTKNVPPLLLELSTDLKMMFEQHINYDMTILLADGTIPCHRAILSARSKWFACQIDQLKSETLPSLKIIENQQIMEALLVYMYTGNLALIESLEVPLLDLREAAEQYGLSRLNKLLTRMIKSEENPCIRKSCEFLWKVNVLSWRSVEDACPSLSGFSLDGTDKWYLKMRPIYYKQEKHFGVYLKRVTTEPSLSENVINIVQFDMHIIDIFGKNRRTFSEIHVFRKDGESRVAEFISLSRLMSDAKVLLCEGVLTLSVQLTITLEYTTSQTTFKITNGIEKDVTNEMHALSHDMYKTLKGEKFCDVSILLKGTAVLRVHSSILYARTLIPTALNGKLMDIGCFESSDWRSFVSYLYTGQARYLEDHMRGIYIAANKLQLSELQAKYSRILGGLLTVRNVFDILSDAKYFGDMELVQSGLLFISKNDIIDNVMWSMLNSTHPNFVREAMQRTRHKKLA